MWTAVTTSWAFEVASQFSAPSLRPQSWDNKPDEDEPSDARLVFRGYPFFDGARMERASILRARNSHRRRTVAAGTLTDNPNPPPVFPVRLQ